MEGTAGPRQAAEQKSNAELLNSTNASQKLPEWFRQSESMLQLPPSQLKEAIVQYMCAHLSARAARARREEPAFAFACRCRRASGSP